MDSIQIQYYKSPFGELILGSYEDQLCICDWRYRRMRSSIDKRIMEGLKANYLEGKSTVAETAICQLEEYFARDRKEFSLQLLLVGTAFQQKIWNELINIPYGVTESYLGLSHKIKNVKAIRAVAAANGANALSIFVPCHRIVGSKGEMIGYAGGKEVKKKLLQLEQALPLDNQLELF